MSKLISMTRYPDTAEVEYVADDFSRIVHNERTGEWVLFRIPSPNDILAAVLGNDTDAQWIIAEYATPVRYTPPAHADGLPSVEVPDDA